MAQRPDMLMLADNLYTPDSVRLRLEEAADTLRRLRMVGTRPAGHKTNWPSIVQDFWESYDIADSPQVRPAAPKPEAIDRMDEVLAWLCRIEDATARGVVWGKACGFKTNRMAKVLGISRYYVDRLYSDGVERLVRRLNGRM